MASLGFLFSSIFVRAMRPAHIAISYHNKEGKKEGQLARGMTARVFQYELDHLDEILFVARLGKFSRARALEKGR